MSVRHAWAFLTRLPGGAHPIDDRALGASVPWFPAVGAILGLLIGGVYGVMHEVVSPITAATVSILFGVVITGAFHEDGLADTADSLGGYSPERRLEIMKDSRVGTFGVLALVFSVLIRVIGLSGLSATDGLMALVLAHAVARSLASIVMVTTPAAAPSGLGQNYTQHLPCTAVTVIGLIVLGCAAVGGPTALAGYVIAVLGTALLVLLARRAYGGTTGDVLGAVEQIGEMAVLTATARLVAAHGWAWG